MTGRRQIMLDALCNFEGPGVAVLYCPSLAKANDYKFLLKKQKPGIIVKVVSPSVEKLSQGPYLVEVTPCP